MNRNDNLPNSFDQGVTIFRLIFENIRRSSKISSMMSINARLRVMRVFLIWAP